MLELVLVQLENKFGYLKMLNADFWMYAHRLKSQFHIGI